MVARKIQAKNPVPKKDMAIQVVNPSNATLPSKPVASTTEGPLASLRAEEVGEDVDELAEDS